MSKICAWDGGSTNDHTKRNREHALGRQLGDLIGGPSAFSVLRSTITADTDIATSKGWSSQTPTEWISKSFCEKCNGGWMARIDDAAKPVLTSLLDEERLKVPSALGEEECGAIALWAFKLSLVFQHVAGNVRSDATVFHAFYNDKEVPEHAAVGVGACTFTSATNAYGYMSQKLPFAPDAVVPTFTLALRHVVIQVVSAAAGRPLLTAPEFSIPLRDSARSLVFPIRPGFTPMWGPGRLVETEEALRGLSMGQPYAG